jgi:hypothetical protein
MAVRLSALRAGRPLTPGRFLVLCQAQGHSAAGRIRWIEKSNYLIGNRTRYLPARSTMPQPTMLLGSIFYPEDGGISEHLQDYTMPCPRTQHFKSNMWVSWVHPFICNQFNGVVSNSEYTAQNGWTQWIMNFKGCGRKQSWPNLRYYLRICSERLRKITKKPVRIISKSKYYWRA